MSKWQDYTSGGFRILFIAGPDLGGDYAGVVEHNDGPKDGGGWGVVGFTWNSDGAPRKSLVETKTGHFVTWEASLYHLMPKNGDSDV